MRLCNIYKDKMLFSKGEVLQLSGQTVTNQRQTVSMQARAKCVIIPARQLVVHLSHTEHVHNKNKDT